jgi:hypothetical protein
MKENIRQIPVRVRRETHIASRISICPVILVWLPLLGLSIQLKFRSDRNVREYFLRFMLTVSQITPLKDRDPYLYEALTKIVASVNATSRRAGVDPSAPAPARLKL